MTRSLSGALAIVALFGVVPATAADYNEFAPLRPAYPNDWETGEDNPLRFEAGLRYWYSLGEQSIDVGPETYSAEDTSHILEGHFRIDDDFTSTFLKGQAGYAIATTGEYNSTALTGSEDFEGGQIGYAGADFGWTPLGNETVKLGALIGYQFLRESPDRDRLDVASIDGLNIHALRLGVTARAEISPMFDIEAEAAVIPYAYASGSTAEYPFDTQTMQGIEVNRTQTDLTGALYGASGQVMFGFRPTENIAIRVGGRAWMLTGESSTQQRWWEAATPESYLYENEALEGLSLLRYGALAELTGRF
jgi:hypothetical protein